MVPRVWAEEPIESMRYYLIVIEQKNEELPEQAEIQIHILIDMRINELHYETVYELGSEDSEIVEHKTHKDNR